GKVVSRQPISSEKIDLEVSQPVLVADVGGVLRFVDTQIVDEDVRLRGRLDELPGSFRRAEIHRELPSRRLTRTARGDSAITRRSRRVVDNRPLDAERKILPSIRINPDCSVLPTNTKVFMVSEEHGEFHHAPNCEYPIARSGHGLEWLHQYHHQDYGF